ncbi:MAG: signal peptidase II [Lachnospiraceae bacterium]|nr:signal peptidase II [Lachnospiraceae bacterium]
MKLIKNKVRLTICLILPVILIALDQFTKQLARKHLTDPRRDVILIPGVLRFQYLENRGAAWGIFQGRLSVLSIISVILVGVFVFALFKIPEGKRYVPLWVLDLVMISGAIGNLIDRTAIGYVTDFIYFELINFPIFNVADIYVTCSVFVLAFLAFFYYTDEELFGKSEKQKDEQTEKGESEE